LIEESLNETQEGLNRADSALKESGDKKPIEEALLKEAVLKVLNAHQDWDLSDYGYSLKETPKAEEKPAEEKKPDEPKKDDQPSGK
jgi:hypothetical protein